MSNKIKTVKVGDSAIWTRADGSSQSVKVVGLNFQQTWAKVIWKTGPRPNQIERDTALVEQLTVFPPGVNFMTL